MLIPIGFLNASSSTWIFPILLLSILTFGIVLVLRNRGGMGKILLGRRIMIPYYLDLSNAKHVVIFGITGSGKTNTARVIAKSFKGSKLIIDWNGEYLIGRVARASDITIANLSMLEFCEALATALQLSQPQYSMLLEVAKTSKSLKEIIEKLRRYPVESDSRREIRNALLRRLEPLSYLDLFSGSRGLEDFDTLDLSGLTYDAKRLVTNVVLRLMYEKPVKDLIVLEEAQNLLTPRRLDQPPSSCELILDEIRKYGVRVVVIAQIPSLVATTYRNAEYILIHRLSLTIDEARNLGLSEKEREKISRLPNGACLVIHRGKKAYVRVLKDKGDIQLKVVHRTSYVKPYVVDKEGNFGNEVGAWRDGGSVVACLLEDVRDLVKWRREIDFKLKSMGVELQEVKQLVKGVVDRIGKIQESSSSLNAISEEVSKLQAEVSSLSSGFKLKMEGIEFTVNYLKEMMLELQELMEKQQLKESTVPCSLKKQ
ncbi:MAG: hypothetical protein DRJ68_01720 [Thermoprotei archaeon]|nr:MAG: hypothetical protein DRJ68_01720 [Thermoprotei archaeon]